MNKQNYPVRILHDKSKVEELRNFPNFHRTGNVQGMKAKYYGKSALLVRHGNYIYNVTSNPRLYFNHSK